MYRAFRVVRPFHWRGWHYGPEHRKNSIDPNTGELEFCDCPFYAGNIWIVEEGHPRLDSMMLIRTVVGDAGIPPVDELLRDPKYKRLLTEPGQALREQERELVHSGRGTGRPKR